MSARAPGLSVCCLTNDEPALVARMLETLQPVTDDIVVGVDSRVDPVRLGPLADVADTLVRFEFVDPPERARPWLVSLCRHPTVLMLDGDEVPSADLLGVLPLLVADDSVVQFRLGRRWCFPDARHWLAERPWWPDYQVRLVRPGPNLDFDLRVHGGARRELPARYVDEPIYHLVCVRSSFTERRRRAWRYEAERPGLVAVGGGRMNETLYVPEHFATLRPMAVPSEDVEVLRAVLESVSDAPRPAPDVPTVPAEEISSFVPHDALQDQGYRARMRIVEHDRRSEPGNNTYMVVEVANDGMAPIPRSDAPGVQVRLGVRLIDARSETALSDWVLTPMPCDIPPEEARLIEAQVPIPERPGAYTLEVNLVNERGRRFRCTTRADLLVASRWGRYAPLSLDVQTEPIASVLEKARRSSTSSAVEVRDRSDPLPRGSVNRLEPAMDDTGKSRAVAARVATLEREHANAVDELEWRKSVIAGLEEANEWLTKELESLRQEVHALKESRSVRYTAPLRAVAGLLRVRGN